jgi:hypothetical protein
MADNRRQKLQEHSARQSTGQTSAAAGQPIPTWKPSRASGHANMLPSDKAGLETIAKESAATSGSDVVSLPEVTVTPEEKPPETVPSAGETPLTPPSGVAGTGTEPGETATTIRAEGAPAEPSGAAKTAEGAPAPAEEDTGEHEEPALGSKFTAVDTTNMEVGPPIGPKERAHMPLSAVAHWIASKGGAISITADEKWWRPAFEGLLAAIVSNRLEVVGRRSGLPETIPKAAFVGIPVAYPCSLSPNSLHLWTGDEPYLECHLFIDEADWQETGGDKLFRSGRDARAEWTHLQVPSSTVARLWRFRRAAHEERAATAALATLLREQPDLTIENARRHCEGLGYRFGRVVFKRIWQNARESAGLPAKASAGRKSGR